MRPVLRPATPGDSEFVFQVKKSALGEYIRQTWGWDEAFQREFHISDYAAHDIQLISVGDVDIGWLEMESDSRKIRLCAIYILPEHQNLGVGSTIIGDLLADALDQGLPVTLEVLKVNHRARAWYERLGFVVRAETTTHFQMICNSHLT